MSEWAREILSRHVLKTIEATYFVIVADTRF
jgi:hypothetical protein